MTSILTTEAQESLVREVMSQLGSMGTGSAHRRDVAQIVATTSELIARHTIDIPRIAIKPESHVSAGIQPFSLDLSGMRYDPPSETLWAAHLRTGEIERIRAGPDNPSGGRLEDFIVTRLIEFDDVAYDDHADLLYNLATQVTRYLSSYLTLEQAKKVLRLHQSEIARLVHTQMQQHFWSSAPGDCDVSITGSNALKPVTYTATDEVPLNFQMPPSDRVAIAEHLYGGFQRCLYPLQKFQSDPERVLALILDREALKWFKPAKGQFQLFYRSATGEREYQPDFVAETENRIYMLEAKALNQMNDVDVIAKRDAAVAWCRRATDHAKSCGGKPWTYVLVPHDAIAENMTIEGLARRHTCL